MRLAILFLALGLTTATAHHDVEEMIRQFTAIIDEQGDKAAPEVYYRRATEYRVLRENDKARADLEKAIDLAPEYIAAHEDLARLHHLHGDLPKALASLETAIGAATIDREKAASLAVRAEILTMDGQPEKALTDIQAALETYKRGAVDWFLLRSDLQAQLDQKEQRLKDLKTAHARTKSVVLYNAWVEALVECGQTEKARPIIEERVASARLKSSWLIRRAKLHQATGEKQAAEKDLRQAIAELTKRIKPENPDVTLLIDRGIAHTMLDERTPAKKDLAAAIKAGADSWVTTPLEKALGVEMKPR